MISPPSIRAFAGSSLTIAYASVDFPEPLSPTIPSISFLSTVRLNDLKSSRLPVSVSKLSLSPRISKSGIFSHRSYFLLSLGSRYVFILSPIRLKERTRRMQPTASIQLISGT